MPDNFKTEYISELMIAGYTAEEAEEQYLQELKEIQAMDMLMLNLDEEDDINY